MFHLNGKICRNKYHPERRTYDIPLSLIYYFLGIGFIQQTTNMHTVGPFTNGPAVHNRFFGFAWAHSPDAASAAGRVVNRPYGHTGKLAVSIRCPYFTFYVLFARTVSFKDVLFRCNFTQKRRGPITQSPSLKSCEAAYSSAVNSSLPTPQTSQTKSSGRSSHFTPASSSS